MIVHLGTTVQTTFAVLDGDGNVVERHPIEAQLADCGAESFAKLAEELATRRRDLGEPDAALT